MDLQTQTKRNSATHFDLTDEIKDERYTLDSETIETMIECMTGTFRNITPAAKQTSVRKCLLLGTSVYRPVIENFLIYNAKINMSYCLMQEVEFRNSVVHLFQTNF